MPSDFNPYDKPSGHSQLRPISYFSIPTSKIISPDYKMDYNLMPNFKNFEGPYKNYKPPGNRIPAVGEKAWGDVPYLPSYLDPMYNSKELSGGRPDNLYFRGPFYKGVSETHTEFVNRGVLPPREYHTFVRHYEEPGLKNERSVTQTDFQPPLPMLPRDKAPCLKENIAKPWFEPEKKQPKNPHAKELEMRPQPTEEVVFVEEEHKRNFGTEHSDNYVCYQKAKTGTKIRDPIPERDEIFLRNIRQAHGECKHTPLSDNISDGSCKTRQRCPGTTPITVSWLLHPKNYSFKNGVMLIPCKCRKSEQQKV